MLCRLPQAIALSGASGCDGVVSMGGGSVIDTGKAVAALLTNGGRPIDYMEVIGAGKSMTEPAQPFIAIPTTSGTGAEVGGVEARNLAYASSADAVTRESQPAALQSVPDSPHAGYDYSGLEERGAGVARARAEGLTAVGVYAAASGAGRP